MSAPRFAFALGSLLALAAPAYAQEEAPDDGAPTTDPIHWGVGFYGRAHSLPSLALDLFYDIHPDLRGLANESIGLNITRRKGDIDLRFSFDYSDYRSKDQAVGDLYQNKGDGINDAEFVRSSLQLYSFDLTVVGRAPLTTWWSLTYGGGLGVGLVQGEMLRNDSFAPDASDPTVRSPCAGVGDPIANCQEVDLAINIPPVIPLPSLLLGMRFDLSKNVSFKIEGGLRTISTFAGAGFDFVF